MNKYKKYLAVPFLSALGLMTTCTLGRIVQEYLKWVGFNSVDAGGITILGMAVYGIFLTLFFMSALDGKNIFGV